MFFLKKNPSNSNHLELGIRRYFKLCSRCLLYLFCDLAPIPKPFKGQDHKKGCRDHRGYFFQSLPFFKIVGSCIENKIIIIYEIY